MPNTDFISKLLEIKDLIVDEIENSSTSTHIFFHLERRDHVCPHCGAITNKVHDYRTSIIKDSPFKDVLFFFTIENGDIIAIAAIHIF